MNSSSTLLNIMRLACLRRSVMPYRSCGGRCQGRAGGRERVEEGCALVSVCQREFCLHAPPAMHIAMHILVRPMPPARPPTFILR